MPRPIHIQSSSGLFCVHDSHLEGFRRTSAHEALLCAQPHFTLISKWQTPPPGLVCEFTPMWFLYVCLPKIQIFIKTASMLERTIFRTPEQSFSSYMSKGNRRGTVDIRTGSSSISPCCRKMLCQKELQGDEVCFDCYFRAQSVAVGKAWFGNMKPAHHTALAAGK